MEITFKNVGQGDSIIVKWEEYSKEKIGIIDCSLNESKNPIVDQLITINWINKPIEFVILSHPHYDHFSGMKDLLNYCESNNVVIQKFCHSIQVHQEYIDYYNLNETRNTRLRELIIKLKSSQSLGLISQIENCTLNWNIKVSNKFSIRCLSPSDDEVTYFAKITKSAKLLQDKRKASKAANLLSTVILFEMNDSNILLTSDATFETFDRIYLREMIHFQKKNVILGQIPHHGSKNNYNSKFWEAIKRELSCPAVVSAGIHKEYNHPHFETLSGFDQHNYRVYSTNHVNGANANQTKNYQKSKKLNMISRPFQVGGFSGDQKFIIKNKSAIYSMSN